MQCRLTPQFPAAPLATAHQPWPASARISLQKSGGSASKTPRRGRRAPKEDEYDTEDDEEEEEEMGGRRWMPAAVL